MCERERERERERGRHRDRGERVGMCVKDRRRERERETERDGEGSHDDGTRFATTAQGPRLSYVWFSAPCLFPSATVSTTGPQYNVPVVAFAAKACLQQPLPRHLTPPPRSLLLL